ncbi:MAG: hypothetical protein JWO46_1170 [Nocardioidaceae bacterium]|nr:hypothetical protein [Nocardioidaceae bacterium]
MKIIRLTAVPHMTVDANGSKGFSIGAFGQTADASLVMVSLKPRGVIGQHRAAARQLLVVIDGDATVTGADDAPEAIGPGQAAVWSPGELHETRTEGGLTALVVEGDVDVATPGHLVDRGDT